VQYNDIKQKQESRETSALDQSDAIPRRRHFWENIWFMFGTVVLAICVVLALVNNTDTTINLLVTTMRFKLPLLILICGFLGVAVEYFIFLGARAEARAELRRLRKQVIVLRKLIAKQ
jgi:uncharacterized integral membrane protein